MADLNWNGDFWEVEGGRSLFGLDLGVYIVTERDEEPTPRQLESIESIDSLSTELWSNLCDQARSYFERIKSATNAGANVDMRKIDDHFKLKDVLIPEIGDCADDYLVLSGECDWEEEHGIQFLLENGNVLHCGPDTGLAVNPCWEDVVEASSETRHQSLFELLE